MWIENYLFDILTINPSNEWNAQLMSGVLRVSNVKDIAENPTKTEIIKIPAGSLGGSFIFLQDDMKIKIRPEK